jgi:hypothetical protein
VEARGAGGQRRCREGDTGRELRVLAGGCCVGAAAAARHTVDPRRPPCRPRTGTWMANTSSLESIPGEAQVVAEGGTRTRRCATVRLPWRALSARCTHTHEE